MTLEKNSTYLLYAFIMACFLVPGAAWAGDIDYDGLSDEDEARYYTNPTQRDTDGDSFADGVEVKNGFSPHASSSIRMHEYDYDQDGLNDWLEVWFKSDIGKTDTDNDGRNDFEEVMAGYSPADAANAKKFVQKIEVDRSLQRLYYFVDKVKIINIPISTGNPITPTPAGEFTVQKKIDNKRYVGADYDLPNVKWNMMFKPGYYIHTAYWHNDFGKRTHSHGCVNLLEKDAELLYKYIDVGVPVKVVGETPKRFLVGT